MPEVKKEALKSVEVEYSGDCFSFDVVFNHEKYSVPSKKYNKDAAPVKVPTELQESYATHLKIVK